MVVNLLNYLNTVLLDFILLALSNSTTDIISGCLIAYDVRVHFSGAMALNKENLVYFRIVVANFSELLTLKVSTNNLSPSDIHL